MEVNMWRYWHADYIPTLSGGWYIDFGGQKSACSTKEWLKSKKKCNLRFTQLCAALYGNYKKMLKGVFALPTRSVTGAFLERPNNVVDVPGTFLFL